MERQVLTHYAQGPVVERVLNALATRGDAKLTLDALAALDEFHVRGRDATLELGAALQLNPGLQVLDVGCGIGGPARRLSTVHGCEIIAVDLVPDYCRLAARLTKAVGLSHLARFCGGSAVALPFARASFDAAYTQHVGMNIADKPTFYAEVARVLRPGGWFGVYDLLQGEGGDLHFPVPWARTPVTSFLVRPDALRSALEGAGFEIVQWQDMTAAVLAWFARQQARQQPSSPSPLNIGLLLGSDFPAMVKNLSRNIAEHRVVPTTVVCRTRK
jgi:SAM-dependent methyltransferase